MRGRPVPPLVTVDVMVPIGGGVVLIERKHPPHGWALPGGFVDVGESLAQAARREAREEISLDVELREQFFAYSDPARDLPTPIAFDHATILADYFAYRTTGRRPPLER